MDMKKRDFLGLAAGIGAMAGLAGEAQAQRRRDMAHSAATRSTVASEYRFASRK